ncbi:hypothetical protein EAH87_14910 [Sphingomonas koreensis]|nr:hypothetical protein EAH87_14910 [Sphingomonas koreensis]
MTISNPKRVDLTGRDRSATRRETALILRLCRDYLTQIAIDYGGDSWMYQESTEIDSNVLLRLLRTNRLWTVAAAARGAAATSLASVAESMAYGRQMATLLNTRALTTLRQIVPLLLADGLKPIVLKGPLRQQQLFSTPFFRASTDLDLLVPRREFARATMVLRNRGFALGAGCDSFWWRTFLGEAHLLAGNTSLCEIDLHHRVQQPGSPGPRDIAEFTSASDEQAIGSITVPVLSASSAWLLSCISFVKAVIHREPAGAYAMEVAAAALAANSDAVAAFECDAIRQGLHSTALFAIGAAEVLFDLKLGVFATARRPAVVHHHAIAELLLDPGSDGVDHLRRSRLLWQLCDGNSFVKPGVYARELGWAGSSEMCRRILHDRAPGPTEA